MLKFFNELMQDRNGKVSLGRFGYLIGIVTSIFWTNVIFFMYVYNAYMGKPMPDMPAQIVMIIVTVLGGYLGIKGTETMAVMGNRGLYGQQTGLGMGTGDTLPLTPDSSEMGNMPPGNLPITGLSVKKKPASELPDTGA